MPGQPHGRVEPRTAPIQLIGKAGGKLDGRASWGYRTKQ